MIEWAIESEASGSRSQGRAGLLEVGQLHVAIVADAAAASKGGREAADAALSFVESLQPRRHQALDPAFWALALERLDAELFRGDGRGETAATVVAVSGAQLAGASCGNSAAHLFQRNAFTELASAQHQVPLLGSGRALASGFGPSPFEGTLVLASDGLMAHAPFRAIWDAAVLPDLRLASEAMASLPRQAGGGLPSDLSILLARPR
jgi:hypothetical protein